MSDRSSVEWLKVLEHQAEWARLFSQGLCSWNRKGFWTHSLEILDIKKHEVLRLLRQYPIVLIQEPHLTAATFPDFADWC